MSQQAIDLPRAEVPTAGGDAAPVGQIHIPFREAFLVALAAGLGYGFDAYAVNIYGMLGPTLAHDLNVSIKTIGIIGSIFLVGYTIGTVGFGFLADRIGRRDALGWSIILYGLTTALGGLSTNLYIFSSLRFLTGVGGAGELAVGAPYTAEMWPRQVRALGTGGIMFPLYSAGYIFAAICAIFIVPRYGWQWAFGFAIVPAIMVFVLRRMVQESVRYKHAQAEIERHIQIEGVRRPRVNIFSIPGAWHRIIVGWLLYVPNACGYWGITVFLDHIHGSEIPHHPHRRDLLRDDVLRRAVLPVLCRHRPVGFDRPPSGRNTRRDYHDRVHNRRFQNRRFLHLPHLRVGHDRNAGVALGIGDTYLSRVFPHQSARDRIRNHGRRRSCRFNRGAIPGRVGYLQFGPTIPFLATAGLWVSTIIGYLIGPETAGRELEDVQL